MKKLIVLFMFVVFTLTAYAQWEFMGAWPDTNYKGGSHGVVVDPDGKVWQASYYQTNWNGINVSPIIVFNSDGSLVDTIYTVTTGGVTDTLGIGGATSGTRGLGRDENGNIIFVSSGPNKIIKIDYQTMEGIARHDITEVGSSPTKPAVSSDGTIFVGPVVGNNNPDAKIVMYDPNLNFLGNAVEGPPAIARTMEVSDDGLTIYWTVFTGLQGIYIYEREDEFSDFELADSVLQGMSIETAAWNPATGLLWVSNDSRGLDTLSYTHLTWYGLDVTTKTLVDSFTLPSPDPEPSDELPRALYFSSDGSTAFVGLFGTKYDRIYLFQEPTGVKPDPNTIVSDYTLAQNYPNPFNPITNIKFTVVKEGFVTLKVYDLLGREVATLVNEYLNNGGYTADFNASDLASGTYIYTLSVNGVSISKKMLLLK